MAAENIPVSQTSIAFTSPRSAEHLKVDVCIVGCIDPRLWSVLESGAPELVPAFMRDKGWIYVPLTEAGGIKVLVSGEEGDVDRKKVLIDRIGQELELHHPSMIVISVHTDCGAYGYAEAFGNDLEAEKVRLRLDLRNARDVIAARFGEERHIIGCIFGMDGVVEEISWSS